MPEVHDWRRVPDPRAVVRRAVEVLRAGGVVAFPTEAGYHLAASGLAPEAVGRLRGAGATESEAPLPLSVLGAAATRDWAPGMGPLGRRLARRFWPGPLTLESGEGVGDGLAGRLQDAVRQEVCRDGRLRLCSPAHKAVLAVMRQLAGPLVLAPDEPGDAAEDVQALGDRAEMVVDDGPTPERQPTTVVQVEGALWKVVRPGAVSADALERQAACLVVFVCTGNTCRSPLAEALCKARLAERLGCTPADLPGRGFHVYSAGLSAITGGPAAEEAVEAARAYGADLSAHASRPLTADLAAQADYLVTMTRGHLSVLADRYRGLAARPRLLSPSGDDLADPVGCPRSVYEECARRIWGCLESFVEELHPPASNAPPNG